MTLGFRAAIDYLLGGFLLPAGPESFEALPREERWLLPLGWWAPRCLRFGRPGRCMKLNVSPQESK